MDLSPALAKQLTVNEADALIMTVMRAVARHTSTEATALLAIDHVTAAIRFAVLRR
jgi:hypothetical protein